MNMMVDVNLSLKAIVEFQRVMMLRGSIDWRVEIRGVDWR